jgi:hypothetical protein
MFEEDIAFTDISVGRLRFDLDRLRRCTMQRGETCLGSQTRHSDSAISLRGSSIYVDEVIDGEITDLVEYGERNHLIRAIR